MFVFPMAGVSRRFREAGYSTHKFKLPLGDRTLFSRVIESFSAYFETHPFLFIFRDEDGIAEFLKQECAALGVADARFVALDNPTRGQAETVEKGLESGGVSRDAAITIFNIDTLRPGFRFPGSEIMSADGYLECFSAPGDNWSFVLPAEGEGSRALETTEKRRISDLCCTGLYHFARAGLFLDSYRHTLDTNSMQAGELYVAPLYNQIIAGGADIRYTLVPSEHVILSGTPDEYEAARPLFEQ
jgi:hypothetical protein